MVEQCGICSNGLGHGRMIALLAFYRSSIVILQATNGVHSFEVLAQQQRCDGLCVFAVTCAFETGSNGVHLAAPVRSAAVHREIQLY
jgi:hypothetical protein